MPEADFPIYSRVVILNVSAQFAPWQNTPHYACYGCDFARPFEVAFCPSCDEQTAGYLVRDECAL